MILTCSPETGFAGPSALPQSRLVPVDLGSLFYFCSACCAVDCDLRTHNLTNNKHKQSQGCTFRIADSTKNCATFSTTADLIVLLCTSSRIVLLVARLCYFGNSAESMGLNPSVPGLASKLDVKAADDSGCHRLPADGRADVLAVPEAVERRRWKEVVSYVRPMSACAAPSVCRGTGTAVPVTGIGLNEPTQAARQA